MYNYDALWGEYTDAYRGHRPDWKAVKKGIVDRMIAHCIEALALYSGKDDYREAMWERRLWLHRKNRSGRVWNGDDPRIWREAMRVGRGARVFGKGGVRGAGGKFCSKVVLEVTELSEVLG
jgi:hypothetical protein